MVVAGSGHPPPTIQWFKNGEPIAGATHDFLDIVASSEEDCGTYICRVQNAHGTVFTDPFELTLAAGLPILLKSPAAVDVEVGSPVELSVEGVHCFFEL